MQGLNFKARGLTKARNVFEYCHVSARHGTFYLTVGYIIAAIVIVISIACTRCFFSRSEPTLSHGVAGGTGSPLPGA